MKRKYADMDPLEEIRAIREEISREFKTVSAYGEYLLEKYQSVSVPTKSSGGNQVIGRTLKPQKAKVATKPARQRKATKCLTHA